MSIVNCKECGKQVSDKAKTCPHCGVSEPYPDGGVGKWTTILAILFTIFIVYKCSGEKKGGVAESQTITPSAEQPGSRARAYCSQFVTKAANDPSSIEWVDRLEWKTSSVDGYTWTVDMRFRAKNGFGALVLTDRRCTVKLSIDGAALISMQ